MPIYEYRCSSCGHKLEALQRITEPLLVACPSCHEDKLVKQVSAAGFQLKGSGWYVTDFRGKGTDKSKAAEDAPAKSDTETASTEAAKTEAKSTTKPASESSPAASSSSPAASPPATPASSGA